MAYTEEELAGLTDEERAALEDEDGSGDPSAVGDEEADEEAESGEAEGGADEGEQAELAGEEGAADSDDAGEDDDTAADESEPAAKAPLYVAEAPADAEAKLTQIAEQKAALVDKFDDGELTAKEYQQQLDALSKEERTIERQLDKAQIAEEMEQQRVTNERNATIGGFLNEVGIPWDDQNPAFAAFNKFVIKVANDPANAESSTREILEKAHAGYAELFGIKKAEKVEEPAAKPTAVKKPIKAPPTLAKLPAAEMSDTDEGNRFAHLDRMDPVSREAALSKLSDADRDNYLKYA